MITAVDKCINSFMNGLNKLRSPQKLNALSVLTERGVPFSTVLDVGVLTGTPELIAAFPNRKHVLFEPVVEFHEEIRKTYAHIPHVLVNTAVSNSTGKTTLAVSSMIDGVEISSQPDGR